MTSIALDNIALRFNLNFWIVKSWVEKEKIETEEQATVFFEENLHFIKATPFVKWVGGKRQLIKQLEQLFPKEFNNYFEPFIGGGAVFFNIQKPKSFLSDINEELINTYQIVKTKPNELINYLENISSMSFRTGCGICKDINPIF
ncbi:MAG: DNA adenine methylase [Candidatus Gracilibacteria bacterium]|nr:DNA adenine methylase [Candidatus Gracilibacteria bacterium]MDD2908721.1 DNA adenine methylase [Candidatus Gracilibacteria bacterium]